MLTQRPDSEHHTIFTQLIITVLLKMDIAHITYKFRKIESNWITESYSFLLNYEIYTCIFKENVKSFFFAGDAS